VFATRKKKQEPKGGKLRKAKEVHRRKKMNAIGQFCPEKNSKQPSAARRPPGYPSTQRPAKRERSGDFGWGKHIGGAKNHLGNAINTV